MKIIHIVNGNDIGGATTQVSALIKAQVTMHQVQVIAFGQGRIVDFCVKNSVAVEVLNFNIKELWRLIKRMHQWDKQSFVMHLHGLKPMLVGALAALKSPIKTVATIHSDYYHEYSGNRLKKGIAVPIIKFSIKHIERFITVSDQFLEVLVNDGINREHCTYIPNGIDLSLIHVSTSPEDFYNKLGLKVNKRIVLGIAARIHPVKGIDVLIDAIHRIGPGKVLLVIAGLGHPDYVAALKEKVSRLGLEDTIVFIGYVENIYDFYNALDINLLTSFSEGVSYSVMEGGALGKPVVCTAVSGMKTLIDPDRDGLMVPIGDAKALADAIVKLVDQSELRGALGLALRNKVHSDYSNLVMAKAYDVVYKQINEE
jgi:glycosyltransferase involved in cell wall biosynthesis